MVRSALGKVAWVGRTASMVFGLALVLALVFGVATMAFGANGQNFILGKAKNAATKVTGLVGNVDGASLRVTNPNTGTNDTALDLRVQAGEAPMRVNSSARVANLNADTLDGRDFSAFMSSSTYIKSAGFTSTANGYATTYLYCDAQDKALSGGYYLSQMPNANAQVTSEWTADNYYRFEVRSEAAAELGWIQVLCADQDGDGAGAAAAATTAKEVDELLEEGRASRE